MITSTPVILKKVELNVPESQMCTLCIKFDAQNLFLVERQSL